MATTAATSHSTTVLSTYRTLHKLIRRLPTPQQPSSLQQLRQTYKANATVPPSQIQPLLEEAGKKIAYLRIITPKDKWRGDSKSQSAETRWVYNGKGEKIQDGVGTPSHQKGKVHSNWSGGNMDPCSVKRHKQQLSRAGFVNNLHAKGLF
uniref:Uncharacterized protein n=1 Tax=Helicotheca tamesis TaxID=374047 RepID=A0A7S2HLR1_9STRA|mmetsp:Transcript_18947/g.26091  ORF Transcript_18947/g.26091 Transcript_18947/m.26091 type:complete len:150 (+) Transcript_18947:59-508(+)|eukprot:CAMPEP_0185728304 /NCGR_PEP_ID=MMETSP1171-20130828/3694_1 /TAXON_ID=374046 /ORGANISM="Helicotheca tamensis, Strain CCMP826" /LENGTH=149 /DNA_ID=CAMNT_0028396995 /DNA_START=25 /DNA_END=474 /DNA_ORIENTATION=-